MNRAFILSQGAARDIGNTSYRTINEPSGVEDSIQIERFLPGGCWYASCGHALGLNSVPYAWRYTMTLSANYLRASVVDRIASRSHR
jgi:hypothetical protein